MRKYFEFIPNENDNLHCLQSCFAMINNRVFNENMTAVEAEEFTNFKKGFPTWQFGAILSFAKKGLIVKDIENFQIDLFLKDPVEAVKNQFKSKEVVDYIIKSSDLDNEIKILQQTIATGNVEFIKNIPGMENIKTYLAEGWFVFCNVNYWLLQGIEGKYDGHFVIIDEINEDYITLQNPGLPPMPNQKVTYKNFFNAWNYPDKNAANLIVVKKRPAA